MHQTNDNPNRRDRRRATKYMLVDGPDRRPVAFPTHLVQDLRDSGAVLASIEPISMAEIRRRGLRVVTEADWRAECATRARLEAYEQYRARYHGVEREAVVLSWDHLRGEGRIRFADDGSAWDIYACNLPGRRTWFPETACVFYTPGETVQVKLDIHPSKTFVLGVTPGYPDEVKRESLGGPDGSGHSRLAFRCNDRGEAINGLIPTGKVAP